MYLKSKRKLTYVLIAVLVLGTVGQWNGSVKGKKKEPVTTMEEVLAEIPAQEDMKTKDYIVMTADEANNESEKNTFLEGTMEVAPLTKETAEKLQEKFEDIIIEEDFQVTASGKNNLKKLKKNARDYKDEWNVKAIHAEKHSSNIKKTKNKIKIAVLDSGVDMYNDIDIFGNVNLVPGEENVSPLFQDETGHGTSVAGIIAATDNEEGVTGINPNAEIYSVKVLDGKNQAPVSRVVEGIYWAIQQDVDIINMSFGMSMKSAALEKAVSDAYQHGILLIAAAGNSGNEGVEYPAAFDEVIAVGSTTTDGERRDDCSVGEELELMAPGDQVKSTGMFDGVVVTGGTSMAAPHVAAVASILWEKDSSRSNIFIRDLLNSTARELGNRTEYGHGILDAAYALECYDDFSNNYSEKTENTLPDNAKPVEYYENVEYINGSWTAAGHEAGIQNSSLNSMEITTLKCGVIYPDKDNKKDNSIMWRLGERPEWHGGYKSSNFISCYLYLTNIASKVANGGTPAQAAVPAGLSASDRDNLKAGVTAISNTNWQQLLAAPNNRYKSLFIWGMAIHTAMDVYAHSAWGKIGGTWEHLNHKGFSNELADETHASAFPGRYTTAKGLARKSLDKYVAGSVGNVNDFNSGGQYSGAGTTWKIKDLYKNANVHNSTVASAIKAYSY